MKALYPASHNIPSLSEEQLSLKIARHSSCSACKSCTGLNPPPGVELVSEDSDTGTTMGSLTQYGSDDEDGVLDLLDICSCGHNIQAHGANVSEIGSEEFARRGRVAVRLDELLQDSGRLLDFEYTDEDITSLRRQMVLPRASISPKIEAPPSPALSNRSDGSPPRKKRRVSVSPLSSDADNDGNDENGTGRALTTKGKSASEKTNGGARRVTGKKSGKKAGTAPMTVAPPTGHAQAEMNGLMRNNDRDEQEIKPKVGEKMNASQLNRIATGVTVDTAAPPSAGVKTEKISAVELRRGKIQIKAVSNDEQPRSMVILTGLKTLFQVQLPKMPREYIARLTYDSNSRGLAIIKRGYKVVGGILFRPFPHRGFTEIVFFATSSVDQEKGYGAMLMDHFKAHIKETYPGMMHFLTYADNFAVGYFRKQGFSKDITLDRSVWAGYIKDYEGGTIMQCTMLPKVDYTKKVDILAAQKEAILLKIREKSKSHIVYEGLPQFQDGMVDEGEEVRIDPKDVPGLRESGWTFDMAIEPPRPLSKSADHGVMQRLLTDLQSQSCAWPFLAPVKAEEVVDYYDVIKDPMDLRTMEHKLDTGQYPNLDAFLHDAQLVFDNCRLYNPEDSIYYKQANKLEGIMKDLLADYTSSQ